ncbi:hypothetical protein N0V88_004509 [Collariella sp. IMI 366227]|nr:hypothetical protein N0V88_004509 [Collariella sp. IMI 366227]
MSDFMTSSNKQTHPALEPPELLDVVVTPTTPSSCSTRSRFEFETGKGNDGTKVLMVEWEASTGDQPDGLENNIEPSDWDQRNIATPQPHPPHQTPPAIFTASLASSQETGQRGVLHTIWARRRLAQLQDEILAEMRENGESVGLEMAMQERQWIVDHFGLTSDDPGIPQPTRLHFPQGSAGPAASPRSPSLVTAISPPATSIATSAISGGVSSLNAIMGDAAPTAGVGAGGEDPNEEDLFALPMSPRSPEMAKSPFSIL